MSVMPPLNEDFFRAAIASGALVPPRDGPDKPLTVRTKLFVLLGVVLACIGGFYYGMCVL
jgi:hypothetical protein